MRALLVLCGVATAASAGNIDWGKGLVTAEGVGVADRHAPNPAVARGTSRRAAEDAARTQLRGKLGELPVASGGTVAERAKDKDVGARLDAAVANAIAVAAQPETDGAWRVTMAVPIEAVRQAILPPLAAGPRALPPAGDAGDAVVIVDGVKAKPAVGWTVAGKHVATVWVADYPGAGKHVTATKAANGAIDADLAGTTATDATLFVIVGKP